MLLFTANTAHSFCVYTNFTHTFLSFWKRNVCLLRTVNMADNWILLSWEQNKVGRLTGSISGIFGMTGLVLAILIN